MPKKINIKYKEANSATIKIGIAAFAFALSAFASTPNTSAIEESEEPASPIDNVMLELQIAGNTYLDGELLTITTEDRPFAYKPTGFNNYIFVGSTDAKATHLENALSYESEKITGLENAYTEKLEELGFKKYEAFQEYKGVVDGEEILCRHKNLGEIGCTPTKDSYDATKKDLINELGAAMPNSSLLVFSDPQIKNSNFAPYQTLETGACNIDAAGCGVALYYRTSPTSNWVYFTGAQSVLSCSEYNTLDLRRAYLDTPCYEDDKTTLSKVTLPDDKNADVTVPNTGTNTNTDSNINGTIALTTASLATIVISIALFKNRSRFHHIKFHKK